MIGGRGGNMIDGENLISVTLIAFVLGCVACESDFITEFESFLHGVLSVVRDLPGSRAPEERVNLEDGWLIA